jgi:hypothetical protein
VPVIHQRGKHQCKIAFDRIVTTGDDNLVSGGCKNRREIPGMNARQVEKDSPYVLRETCGYRITFKARTITAGNGVFAYRSTPAAQVGDYYYRNEAPYYRRSANLELPLC